MPATEKTQNFSTVEEAIKGAGTSVLSHLESRAHMLTRDEVKQYEEDNNLIGKPVEGAYRAYAGPYTDLGDERNAWTAAQDMGETDRTKEAAPDPNKAEAKKTEPPKNAAPPPVRSGNK